MEDSAAANVLVEIVDVGARRQITTRDRALKSLHERTAELQAAIVEGCRAVAISAQELSVVRGWQVRELEASFGVSLSGDAGIIVTKLSAAATFEVKVKLVQPDRTSEQDTNP
jgi:hypothetical protein